MKTAIIVNLTKPKAIVCAARICILMKSAGAEILMPPDCAEFFPDKGVHFTDTVEQLFETADAAITVNPAYSPAEARHRKLAAPP